MRIVLWIGNGSNQKALSQKIHERFPISAIIVESRTTKKKRTLTDILKKCIEYLFAKQIADSWFKLMRYYEKHYPKYPHVPMLEVSNINSDETLALTMEMDPDLIIVSGTRMVKKKLLGINPGLGILNLHTGLSPYIKGGPNCTNWCIATKQFHLIGNTIMWIDEGIDSGNIMATEFTEFSGDESLYEIHKKVMDHAHQLYVEAISKVSEGAINNIPQKEIGEGVTFYNKQWVLKQKMRLAKNLKLFRRSIKSNDISKDRENIKTVAL